MPALHKLNQAACSFGLDVLQEAQEALGAALPEQKAQVEAVLSKLKEEFSAQLEQQKKGRGKKGAAAGAAPAAKRPPSAYNVFMGEKLKELGKDSKLSKSDLMKKVAELWKAKKAEKK
jgi:hypothetical protein